MPSLLNCIMYISSLRFPQVSSVEIERICNGVNSNILETAAIGVPPAGGGPEQLVIVVVLKNLDHATANLHQLRTSFNSALQKSLNPLFRVFIFLWVIKFLSSYYPLCLSRIFMLDAHPFVQVSRVVSLSSLPRTASNKVMRRVLRKQLSELSSKL